MLGLVGVIFAEQSTGISWADAGKVLNEQPSYLGFDINLPVTTLVWIEVLSMGFAEVKRSAGASSVPRAPLLRVFSSPGVFSSLYESQTTPRLAGPPTSSS